MGKDGSRRQALLQLVEGLLLCRAPLEGSGHLRQLRQRQSDLAVPLDEFAVVARQAEEGPHLRARRGCRPCSDRLHLVLLHMEAGLVDDVSEEGHLTHKELALLGVSIVPLLTQPPQQPPHHLLMLLYCLRVDEDVVDEDHHRRVQSLLQHPLHLALEDGRGRSSYRRA